MPYCITSFVNRRIRRSGFESFRLVVAVPCKWKQLRVARRFVLQLPHKKSWNLENSKYDFFLEFQENFAVGDELRPRAGGVFHGLRHSRPPGEGDPSELPRREKRRKAREDTLRHSLRGTGFPERQAGFLLRRTSAPPARVGLRLRPPGTEACLHGHRGFRDHGAYGRPGADDRRQGQPFLLLFQKRGQVGEGAGQGRQLGSREVGEITRSPGCTA